MAIYTGNYPVLGAKCWIGSTAQSRVKLNGGVKSTHYNLNDTEFLYSNVINSSINHTDITTSPIRPTNWFGPWNVSVQGEPSVPVPDRLIEGPLIKTNNRPFQEKVRRGAMVVSDFTRLNALVKYHNGGPKTVLSRGVIDFTTSRLAASFRHPTYAQWSDLADTSWSLNVEREILWAPSALRYPYERVTFSDGVSPYDVGWDDSVIEVFLNEITYPDSIHQLVTQNTADANAATVDILTTLAEMPETAKSILQGFSALKKLFVDAKAKKFSLLNKAKRVRLSIEQKIHRIDFESHQAYLAARNERERRMIENKRIRSVEQLKADLKKSAEDLATGIAQVELTVRYGILPVKYTIDGFIESFENLDMIYKRWSSRSMAEIEFPNVPGFKKTGSLEVSLRAFIKRRFEALEGNFKLLKHLSGSLIVTAWELIPLSFVVDWFINIGDVLQSFFGSVLSDFQQAATISLKIESGSCTYVHESTGCSVTVEVKGYMRNVINPSDYCRFFWEPDVSGYRTYDAAALSWLFLKKFFHSWRA